jgi:hypothetical protein
VNVLLQAGLDGFAVVGGSIAVASGALAALALSLGQDVSKAADRGVAIGGIWGVPPALIVFFLELAHAI